MPPKVLVAHGSTQQLRASVRALHGLGFDVVATPDGGDAFARFFDEEPDVVVCNVALPSLSGPGFARMVRSQSPDTPVVLINDGDLEGIDSEVLVIADPFDIEAFKLAVPGLIPDLPRAEDSDIDQSKPADVFITAALKKFQKGNNLLSLLDDAGLARMAAIAQRQFRAGDETVIQQGDPGDGFYFLVEGQVRVTLAEQQGAEVARINAGGFFGEMALLSDQPRSASVSTVGGATLLWFDREHFLPILADYPTIREILSGVALRRTEENLWRVLFDDDDVQETLGTLDEASDLVEDAQIEAAAAVDLAATSSAAVEPSARRLAGRLADALEPPGTSTISLPLQQPARSARVALLLGLAVGLVVGVAIGAVTARYALTVDVPQLPLEPDAADDIEGELPAGDAAQLPAMPEEPEAGADDAVAPEDADADAGAPADADADGDADAAGADAALDAPPLQDEGGAAAAADSAAADLGVAGAKAMRDVLAGATPKKAESETELAERKTLRRKLFALYGEQKYGEAGDVGLQLYRKYATDWEAHFMIAESLRQAGRNAEAESVYLSFAASYADNLQTDDARFWAAEAALARGDKPAAKQLFEQVAADAKSNLKAEADKRLAP